jgi:UDP-N-acetylglucosamine--N-acetylmuramyl-(pentapeptide) pyrophosphoryl-undecaprenol N-acetylglucosamine transferase
MDNKIIEIYKIIIMKKTIALTWGGSWGHIIPLLSVYNYLKEEDDYNFLWVWEQWELENKISIQNNIEFHDIASGKIRKYFDFRNFYEPLKNITGLFQGIFYILKYKIDIVFSKGWYVSLPLCFAAKIMWKKIYIHESDVKTWIANKIISKFATKIFHSFQKEKYSKREILTGQILNSWLLDGLIDLDVPNNDKMKVLVIAWSQGSTIIFKNLIKAIPDLPSVTFEIILWEKNLHFRDKLDIFVNTIVHDFVDQKTLWNIYKNTDIAITRGSATVLAELYYFGIHSIIVPVTNAWWHQIHNANYYNKEVWSDILDENKHLWLEIFRKLNKYQDFRKNSLNLEWFFDAMKTIEKEIKN